MLRAIWLVVALPASPILLRNRRPRLSLPAAPGPLQVVDDRGIFVDDRGVGAQTVRLAPRNVGPADPKDDRQGTTSWVGNRQAHAATLRRSPIRWTGFTVSGIASARTTRLDQRGMEGLRSRAYC